ncbi:MAG: hypothetical protein WD468_01640 [Pirellulales bacterium]
MFDLLKHALVLSRRPPIDDVIREVTRRSMAEVERRLSSVVTTMSEAELRGYVRARAARPVRSEAERLATEQGWRIALSDSLIASALERTVYLVVYRSRMQPVVSGGWHALATSAA